MDGISKCPVWFLSFVCLYCLLDPRWSYLREGNHNLDNDSVKWTCRQACGAFSQLKEEGPGH